MDLDRSGFFLKQGYKSKSESPYYVAEQQQDVVHQPLVYDFAAYLAERYGCSRIIDLGCGRASKLAPIHPRMDVVGVDFGENIEWCRRHYAFGEWVSHDFERGPLQLVERAKVAGSVVVCADVVEHLVNPTHLLATVRDLLEYAPVAVLTTPERDLVRGRNDMGPPANPWHVREWNMSEFRLLLEDAGIEVLFHGLTFNNNVQWQKRTIVTVVRRPGPALVVPPEFRVVALVGVYNEEDVIVPFLEYTISQGIEVHLLDNGSTDRTAERAARFLHRGLRAIEKFPESGPSPTHDWAGMLNRKAELASRTEGDWFIHLDADEIRESPWPGLTLREALCRVDREGFNAVDHACVVFHPTGGNFLEDRAIQPQFPYFEFGTRPAHFMQIKAWKRQPGPVECAESAGHAVSFPGRRVYPFKFLLRHYPIRSQQHGEKKVFVERLPRFRPVLRARGWHKQYDGISRNHAFVRDPSTLSCFSPETFYDEYMIERLSGIGIARPGNAAAPGSGYRINTGGVTAE